MEEVSVMERILTYITNPLMWMLLGIVVTVAAAAWLFSCRVRAQRQSRLLNARLRAIGELAVEEARVTLVHCTREPRRFFGVELPLVREQCIFAIDVVVKAGCDFHEIRARMDHRRRITLHLPQMRLLSSAVDYESMQIYDEKTGVFARPKLEWHRASMMNLCREAEEKALGYGILDRAQESARVRLTAFVGQLCDLTECTLYITQPGGVHQAAGQEKSEISA